MVQRSADPAAIEAEVDHIRSLGIVALRWTQWRLDIIRTSGHCLGNRRGSSSNIAGALEIRGLTARLGPLVTPIHR